MAWFSAISNIFDDVAVDASGDIFVLENTSDGLFGTQVVQIAQQGQFLTTANSIYSSEDTKALFPYGLCVDQAGQTLNVVTIDIATKCVIDQFGTVYEQFTGPTTDTDYDNVGAFSSQPTPQNPTPTGTYFFPNGDLTDTCGNTTPGVSGSVYGLSKDGSGFLYFVDKNGGRINKYDPGAPTWVGCTPAPSNGIVYLPPKAQVFTTLATSVFPIFGMAADTVGNLYLTSMPFSLVQEMPRAYVSSAGPINEPVTGGTGTIQVLPATQALTGVFAPTSSDSTWLTVNSAANGTITFSVSPNPGPARTGTLTVLGVPVKVTQAESQVPTAMTIVSGNNQTIMVNSGPFPTNLLVKVTNQFGDAVANVPVNFSSQYQQYSTNTSQRGYAAATNFLAYNVGSNPVTVTIPGTNLTQTFTLTGTGASATSLQPNPAALNFVLPYQQQQTLISLAQNNTLHTFTITAVSLVQGNSDFLLENDISSAYCRANQVIPPGGACYVIVQYSANSADYGSFIIQTISDNGESGQAAVVLSGSVSGDDPLNTVRSTYGFSYPAGPGGIPQAWVATTRTLPGPFIVTTAGQPTAGNKITFTVIPNANGASGTFPGGFTSVNVLTDVEGDAASPLLTANSIPGVFQIAVSDGYFQNALWTVTSTQCYNSAAPAFEQCR